MTAVPYVERAQGWARIMEDREKSRSGLDSVDDVRLIVARKTGVPSGTLLSLRKKRLKSIAPNLYEALRAGVIRELEAELRHVQHEINLAHQAGLDPASGEAHALLASEARIREALGLPTERGGA